MATRYMHFPQQSKYSRFGVAPLLPKNSDFGHSSAEIPANTNTRRHLHEPTFAYAVSQYLRKFERDSVSPNVQDVSAPEPPARTHHYSAAASTGTHADTAQETQDPSVPRSAPRQDQEDPLDHAGSSSQWAEIVRTVSDGVAGQSVVRVATKPEAEASALLRAAASTATAATDGHAPQHMDVPNVVVRDVSSARPQAEEDLEESQVAAAESSCVARAEQLSARMTRSLNLLESLDAAVAVAEVMHRSTLSAGSAAIGTTEAEQIVYRDKLATSLKAILEIQNGLLASGSIKRKVDGVQQQRTVAHAHEGISDGSACASTSSEHGEHGPRVDVGIGASDSDSDYTSASSVVPHRADKILVVREGRAPVELVLRASADRKATIEDAPRVDTVYQSDIGPVRYYRKKCAYSAEGHTHSPPKGRLQKGVDSSGVGPSDYDSSFVTSPSPQSSARSSNKRRQTSASSVSSVSSVSSSSKSSKASSASTIDSSSGYSSDTDVSSSSSSSSSTSEDTPPPPSRKVQYLAPGSRSQTLPQPALSARGRGRGGLVAMGSNLSRSGPALSNSAGRAPIRNTVSFPGFS